MDIQSILAQLMQGGSSPSGMPWSDQQNIPPPMPGPPGAAPTPSGAATGAVDPMGAFGNAPGMPPTPMPPGATPPTPATALPPPIPALGRDNGADPSFVRRLLAKLLSGGGGGGGGGAPTPPTPPGIPTDQMAG